MGDQDPLPGASKQLILKYLAPPGASISYLWLKVAAHTRRAGMLAFPCAGIYIYIYHSINLFSLP